MENFASAIITAVGLVLVLEGILYAVFPDGMQRLMAQLLEMPPASLRNAGIVFAVFGCAIVWIGKYISQ